MIQCLLHFITSLCIIFNVNHHGLVRYNVIIIIISIRLGYHINNYNDLIMIQIYCASLCRYQLTAMTIIVMIIILLLLDQTRMEQLVLERLVWYMLTVSVEWVWLMMQNLHVQWVTLE